MQLQLRKFQKEDFASYFSLVGSDLTMKYISRKGLSKEEAEKKFHKHLMINQTEKELGIFSVHRSKDNAFVGLGKLTRESINTELSFIELGYAILPKYWNQGFGKAMVSCLLAKVSKLNIENKVLAISDSRNIASTKILESQGFQLIDKKWDKDELLGIYELST